MRERRSMRRGRRKNMKRMMALLWWAGFLWRVGLPPV
jgi:hypothetical protein